ncbi:MAG: APC family permease [Actinomycetota bacterium]|nr:APC family permease [Actinomycetota bacterium]
MAAVHHSGGTRTAPNELPKTIGTWQVFAAGVALVVATTTLVSDFNGYFSLGLSFAVAIFIAFIINMLLGLSVAELSVDHPRAGALFEYGKTIVGGTVGRFIGVFLAFTFAGMFVFAGAGETAAGGLGLQALVNSETNLNLYIIILAVAAVIPNLFGIRIAAWVSAILLLGMLGIRWFFGLAGFLGFSDAGPWSAANLDTGGPGALDWFGAGGLLATGLVLGFWTFVGIEFVAPLAEETKNPRRNMPMGIVIGLLVILGTSWLMGLGVTGATPPAGGTWAELAASECDGSCPQLVVGEQMFGGTGRGLMALASVSATLGSMIVAFAAIPRILFGVAREGLFFGPLSKPFGTLNSRLGTPVVAIITFAVVSTTAALFSANVVDWIFAGAYVWLLLYIVYHVLLIANRLMGPSKNARHLLGPIGFPVAIAGFLLTIMALYYAFLGSHAFFMQKSAWVLGVALLASVVAIVLPHPHVGPPSDEARHADQSTTAREAKGERP